MPIAFDNLVKGQITQALVTSLLERGGYRVTRFGIEELFSEVKHLTAAEYATLGLPAALRTLPDLLVAPPDISSAFQVEVKFRLKFTGIAREELAGVLRRQREHWPASIAVLLVGESWTERGRFHQDYIRVVRPEDLTTLADLEMPSEDAWEALPQIQQVFRLLSGSNELQKSADMIIPALQSLALLRRPN